MEEEQVAQSTATAESSAVSETADKTKQSEPAPEPETYSSEDYHKAVQASASKAKFELLKELGINGVKEFKDLKASYDNTIKQASDLETKQNELNEKYKALQSDLTLEKLGVSEEYKQDLLTLAKNKVDDKHSLEEVSKDLLIKYPQWLKENPAQVRIGSERSKIEATKEDISDLQKKYPWIH